MSRHAKRHRPLNDRLPIDDAKVYRYNAYCPYCDTRVSSNVPGRALLGIAEHLAYFHKGERPQRTPESWYGEHEK